MVLLLYILPNHEQVPNMASLKTREILIGKIALQTSIIYNFVQI